MTGPPANNGSTVGSGASAGRSDFLKLDSPRARRLYRSPIEDQKVAVDQGGGEAQCCQNEGTAETAHRSPHYASTVSFMALTAVDVFAVAIILLGSLMLTDRMDIR